MTSTDENITVERLDLKPEWVEHPGEDSRDYLRTLILFFLGGFIILIFLGEGLGELLLTALVIWISLFVIFSAAKKTNSIQSWSRIKNKGRLQNLPLKKTSDTTKRAIKGFQLSQMLIEKRLRENFKEKMKDEKSLSEEEMKELMDNPSELEDVIDDKVLFDFMINSKRVDDLFQKDTKSIFSNLVESIRSKENSKEKKEKVNFEKKMEVIIEKISRWEKG